MQRERRRDPYPWTWEIPVALLLATSLVIVVGVQLGRSVANLLAGAGWTWPAVDAAATAGAFTSPVGSAFWTSLPDVLAGHSNSGLPSPTPGGLAGPGLLWASVALTEVAMLSAMTWVGVRAYRRWGPSRMLGMATAAEAERLLGVTRLRTVAGIVRPDLYGKHTSAPGLVHRTIDDAAANHPGPSIGGGLGRWLLDHRATDSVGE
jgi:hypothetical protein